jgi:hypothetical protein
MVIDEREYNTVVLAALLQDSVKSFLQILLRALFSRVSIDTIMPQSFESLRPGSL